MCLTTVFSSCFSKKVLCSGESYIALDELWLSATVKLRIFVAISHAAARLIRETNLPPGNGPISIISADTDFPFLFLNSFASSFRTCSRFSFVKGWSDNVPHIALDDVETSEFRDCFLFRFAQRRFRL